MNKKVLGVFGSLFVVAMLTVPMSMVYAKNNPKLIPVSGTLQALSTATPVSTPAGNSGNVRAEVSGNTINWTGSFVGLASADSLHWIIHKGFSTRPWYTATHIHTLEAVFDGDKSGTLTIITTDACLQGHWRILSGTGDLANLHGQGTLWAINPFIWLYGYEGYVHFDP